MTVSWWSLSIGLAGDCLLVWLSLRYVIRPRLEKFVRRVTREELVTSQRLAGDK